MRRYRRANQRRVNPNIGGNKEQEEEQRGRGRGEVYTAWLVTGGRGEGERRYGDEGSAQDEGVMDAGYGGS